MEMTTAQRVRRLRAAKAARDWQNSPIRKGYAASVEINSIMGKHFPKGWSNFKLLMGLGGIVAMTQVAGYICLALTGEPLN